LFYNIDDANEEWERSHKMIIEMAITEEFPEKRMSVDLAAGNARERIGALDDMLTQLTRLKEENAGKIAEQARQINHRQRRLWTGLALGARQPAGAAIHQGKNDGSAFLPLFIK